MLPESDQPEFKQAYPDWIKIFKGFRTSKIAMLAYFLGFTRLLKRLNLETISVLEQYDVCVFSSKESWFIPFISNTTIFRCTGSDLTVAPLFTFTEYKKLQGQKLNYSFNDFRSSIEWSIKKRLSAKAIRASDFVDVGCGDVFSNAANALLIPETRRVSKFRLAIDTNVFKNRMGVGLKKEWNLNADDFHVFLPSRIMIRDTPELRRTGQWKASDRAIYGFSIFLNQLSREEQKESKINNSSTNY